MTDLRERFERDLADLQPPAGFEDAALGHGRRLRARRRLAGATGCLTTVGVAVAAAAVVLGGGSQGSGDPGFADDPPASPEVVLPGPTTGWWEMPAKRMLTELRQALPDGVTVTEADVTDDGLDGPVRGVGGLSGILTADTGPGAFQVLLIAPDPTGPPPDAVTTTDAEGNTTTTIELPGQPLADRIRCRKYMTTCDPVLDGAGRVVGRVSTDEQQGTTLYEVALLGPDGGGLNLTVMDSSGEKPGYEPPSASAPPLTTDQLLALAQDPVWTDYEPED
jgi:hypothetical protein